MIFPASLYHQECRSAVAQLSEAPELQSALISVYRELLENMPIAELEQLKENPLRLPISSDLLSTSSHLSILKTILPRIPLSFSSELRGFVETAIEKLSQKKSIYSAQTELLKNVEKDFIIQTKQGKIKKSALSPDGILYILTESNLIFAWNLRTQKPHLTTANKEFVIENSGLGFTDIILNSKGSVLYLATPGGWIRLWNAATGEEILDSDHRPLFQSDYFNVTAMKLSKDEERLYIGTAIGEIYELNLKSKVLLSINNINSINGRYNGSSGVENLDTSADEKFIYSRNFRGELLKWQIPTNRSKLQRILESLVGRIPVKRWKGVQSSIFALNPANENFIYYAHCIYILGLGEKSTVALIRNQKKIPRSKPLLTITKTYILQILVSKNGKLLFIAASDGGIRALDTATNQLILDSDPLLQRSLKVHITTLGLSVDQQFLYACDDLGNIQGWHLKDYIPSHYFD